MFQLALMVICNNDDYYVYVCNNDDYYVYVNMFDGYL